ncbi:hypothetical protein K1X76_03880 [bacterium]|nr:hypothetical protein [bacterium]
MRTFTKLFFITFILIFSLKAHAFVFTGDIEADFKDINCITDPLDVGIPEALQNLGLNTSGWDMEKVCFFYDGSEDTMHVGVKTYDGKIFGDADGNGDPSSGETVPGLEYEDLANLGRKGNSAGEAFFILWDLNGDAKTLPAEGIIGMNGGSVDIMTGLAFGHNYADFGRYIPNSTFITFLPQNESFYNLESTITPFAQPSQTYPYSEFSIPAFTQGYQIDPRVTLYVFAGSNVDAGIGDDYITKTKNVFDDDEDDCWDWVELKNGTNPNDPEENCDETPSTPENPEDPTNPETPEEPTTPENPETPQEDDNAGKPSTPAIVPAPAISAIQVQGSGSSCALSIKSSNQIDYSILVLLMGLLGFRFLKKRLAN